MDQTQGVIFDLDGVIVDTGEYHRLSWWETARLEGWHDYSDEVFLNTFGMQNAQIIPMLVKGPISPVEVARISAEKERCFRELITGKLTLLPGVKALVDDLKAHGFRIAVGTSTPKVNFEFMLSQTGILQAFDGYATSEDAARSKPAPDTFLKAAERISLPPRACVVIEDAVAGVQAGKAAGMKVVAVTTTRPRAELHQADRVVDSLAELTASDFTKLLNGYGGCPS